ncbi:hypothetical protein [Sphingomonas sp. DBB INV C78]|uniref:hypothetical protein n=1 Tax=Sphingomonas sp. DBB INV C78 TaxID=3349434 RepID=UPI0036D39027
MKYGLLALLCAALSGCSPQRPSALDVQHALEKYYQDFIFRGQYAALTIVRCPPISELEVSSNGEKATAVFRFSGLRGGYDGYPLGISAIELMRGREGWYIQRVDALASLKCEALYAGLSLQN